MWPFKFDPVWSDPPPDKIAVDPYREPPAVPSKPQAKPDAVKVAVDPYADYTLRYRA